MASSGIFLTGATGYAGQCVLAELRRRDIPVTALVRQPVALDGCRTVQGTLATIGLLAADILEAEGIVHLASPRSQARGSVVTDDILGTGRLLDLWQRGPFVYASSSTVHGVPKGPLVESSPLEPRSWYDIGKVCNEFQVEQAQGLGEHGPGISLRPALIFAANERRHDRQFMSDVFIQCQLGATFLFDSEEGVERYGASYIGGADFGRAVADSLAIAAPGPFMLAGGFCTWRELIEAINRQAGTNARIAVRDGDDEDGYRLPPSRTELDTSAFRAATGFTPQQSLDELIYDFVRRELAVAGA